MNLRFAPWARIPGLGRRLQKKEAGNVSRTMKRRIFCGAICEQIVYQVPDRVRNTKEYDPEKAVKKERFADEAAYEKFKTEISRRNHYRSFMANYGPDSIFSTLTFDAENEINDFTEARQVRSNFRRALERACPEARFRIYMGRGKTTHRIHFHMVSKGIPLEVIREKWKYGDVKKPVYLRKRCKSKDGKDLGQDYSALANYLFDHWTKEVGGHRYFATKNEQKPEKEDPTEVHIKGKCYSENKPPKAPKGYRMTICEANQYGFQYFRYAAIDQEDPSGRGTA